MGLVPDFSTDLNEFLGLNIKVHWRKNFQVTCSVVEELISTIVGFHTNVSNRGNPLNSKIASPGTIVENTSPTGSKIVPSDIICRVLFVLSSGTINKNGATQSVMQTYTDFQLPYFVREFLRLSFS